MGTIFGYDFDVVTIGENTLKTPFPGAG